MEYCVEDIFESFRLAWCKYNKNPRRKPKDFTTYFNKQSSEVQEALTSLTNLFNLFWVNVDPYRYFIVGLSLGIELDRMHDPDVIERYKVLDYYRLKDNKQIKDAIRTSLISLTNCSPHDLVQLFLDHKVSLFVLGLIHRYGLFDIASADTHNDKNIRFMLESYIAEDMDKDMKLLNQRELHGVVEMLRKIYA